MDEYTHLVSRVVQNKVLSGAAKEMGDKADPATFNLVTEDWQKCFESDAFAQCSKLRFIPKPSPSPLYTYESCNESLNLTIVGKCRLLKSFDKKVPANPAVIIEKSYILNKLLQNMTQDLGPVTIDKDGEFKFHFHSCSILSCKDCKGSYAQFHKMGYTMARCHQPCISVTKIYDGENIYNRFYSQMEEMFPNTFMGVMHLTINSRYSYEDPKNRSRRPYRISGFVRDFVALNEAKLDCMQPINLGMLTTFEEVAEEPLPAPTEKDEKKSAPISNSVSLPTTSQLLTSNEPCSSKNEAFTDIFMGGEAEKVVEDKTDEALQDIEEEIKTGKIEDDISMAQKVKIDNDLEDEFDALQDIGGKRKTGKVLIEDDIAMVQKVKIDNDLEDELQDIGGKRKISEVVIEDDIAMVQKVKIDNDRVVKKPRIEEDYVTIDQGGF